MPVFAFKALDQQLTASTGQLAADSPYQAREELRRRGLTVEELTQLSAKRDWFQFWHRPQRYEAKLIPALRELATLLSASIPLSDALHTVAKQRAGQLGTAFSMLHDRVTGGCGLAEAMREQPYLFDQLTVQMVEVGENSGSLDEVLDQWSDFREKYAQFKDRVVNILAYPAFVLVTSIVVVVFLMGFVIPMLLDNLLDAGGEIPWPTQILKFASDMIRSHGIAMAGVVAVALAAAIYGLSTRRGKRAWHALALKLPLLGTIVRKQEIARASLIIATLMDSGLVFLESLAIAAKATRNEILKDAFAHIHSRVQNGADIGEAMAECQVFPEMVIQICAVGQQTGKLESMLMRLSSDYDRQVSTLATRLSSILEPALIVVLAVFIGFVLYATMLPILEAGNVM